MVQTVLQQETAALLSRITALYHYFNMNKDIQTAERARDLALKLKKQEYSIAFCGHFSAGKSSMINKLMGEELLPSSPIPTSANLVRIKAGEDYAKVMFKEGKPRIYPAPYDYDKVKTLCKDGDQIQSIEIGYSNTDLPKETVIMDTPGIDSTDDAHRIATESALHLADLVFYVMDYNHVQSELNFLFTKELTAAGKQVYLIINQIDKHREDELSFEQFKGSVLDSFASWGVAPARIFYTSLKNIEHKENEFSALKHFIEEKMAKRKEFLPESVFRSLKKLTDEHYIYLEEINGNAIEKYEMKLREFSNDERELLTEKVAFLENQISKNKDYLNKMDIQLNHKIDEVLKNAYLMPFQTREFARSYIESCQSSFKVGLFFSRQKTEDERKARLERFYHDFSEKVTSQLDWHLKELFLHELKEQEIHDPALVASAQNFQVHFEESMLTEMVKEGALLSGDYVLQYTNDVADSVKRLAKKSLSELKELFLHSLKIMNERERNRLEVEWQQLQGYAEAFHGLTAIKEMQNLSMGKMADFLAGDFPEAKYKEKMVQLLAEQDEEAEVIYHLDDATSNENEENNLVENELEQSIQDKPEIIVKYSTQLLIEKLKFTANAVHDVPGFKKIAAELSQKAERLEHKQFTVALFGAFSAGKSSFANALIGKKVLPVSPNPTTAAINKIMPINEINGHGTVLVKVKDNQVLFDDVNRSLKVFDMRAADFDDAVIKVNKVISGKTEIDANEKTHYAFLHAFLRGFDSFRHLLGTTVKTDLEELKEYVAIEEKSCFVEMIEVYYDCDLTQKGITLVDTPGADSINARHTGVAFDYIKNSDAILFVTYYNHAFSKADREFLIQLGRVKDSFELDKMFFIVNAIDLANNVDEKNSVLEYVEEQLIQYGIRRPHLFGLSSLAALAEKLDKQKKSDSKMNLFEESFYAFITNELMQMSVASAELEWQRVLEQLRTFIQSSQESKELRAQKRNQLEKEQKSIKDLIGKQDTGMLAQRLAQEADELVFYIKQRVFLRFNDFVKESFNPALLKDDGRNLKKALQTALEDFLQSFGYDFAQELRATTVRMESFIGKLLKQSQEMLIKETAELNEELSFSPFEVNNLEGIDFDTAFVHEEREQYRKALAYFKNPKSFFEKNERKYLSEELEQIINGPSDNYLQTENIRLKNHYLHLFKEEHARMQDLLIEQTDEYYDGLLVVLTDNYPIDQLKEIENEIANFENKNEHLRSSRDN